MAQFSNYAFSAQRSTENNHSLMECFSYYPQIIGTFRYTDMTETCANCSHIHFAKSDDGAIDNSQICDIDGFFIIKTTHRCGHWKERPDGERNVHILDSLHLDSRDLMIYKNGSG